MTYQVHIPNRLKLKLFIPLQAKLANINMSCTTEYIFTVLHVVYHQVDIYCTITYSAAWSFLAVWFGRLVKEISPYGQINSSVRFLFIRPFGFGSSDSAVRIRPVLK